jgi:hypothetical protein
MINAQLAAILSELLITLPERIAPEEARQALAGTAPCTLHFMTNSNLKTFLSTIESNKKLNFDAVAEM